ncbi:MULTISPECIES: TonB-dependent siderophore receptor [unclassified Novosphingobium]|uniref:TonB-dependent receptor plug domain-containing protein n=1 Tax=unclassified Novosphingobium TaxID=2644732 RepID=UPI0018086C82|nr:MULTISPECIES: TonB-dependent receptor [unclassified Novosphingobium]MBB3358658.1 outer membrane receptor protein involved in Fe transport [Novosphingobium sp. BK256]MBB3375019.1 outer membrane receptor protein involved in Fe transport [Novosphingobium sp. BK280]MBB3379293.1 outer membrane receptor protein involved in Fe transport [Novosphingobium sp. BK258]MBB3420987.1 outer membrane receptor protein involved in Fe transport [Novosphingobium sp. BK267]MBB3449440.1 outer membrane receptor pr
MASLAPAALVSAALGQALPSAAWAAEAPDAGDGGATIVVTGEGLGQSPAAPAYDTQTISAAQLQATASGRIDDALLSAAGVQQFRRSDSRASNPSAQGITLRALGGNATSRTLVLLDGVPMADPFFGYIPMTAIDPERLASVRVQRGGGSGAFGAGAVAGTVDMTSAGAQSLGLLNAQGMVDDRGETSLSAALAPKLGQGFAVVTGRWDRGQGFWTTPESQRVPASVRARYDSWSTGVRAVAPLTPDVELQARVAAFEDNRTLRFAGADNGISGQDASLRLVGRGAWQFDALAYVQTRDFHAVTVSSTSFKKTLDQYATPSTGLGGKLELRPPVGGGHVLKLGTDWRRAEGETKENALSAATGLVTARRRAGGHTDDVGFFIEDDWTLGTLVLTAGGRADRWAITQGHYEERNAAGVVTSTSATDPAVAARSGWQGSWRAGAMLNAASWAALRGAAYTGLRLPTLNELYRSFTLAAPNGNGGVSLTTTQRNPTLRNERLLGFEAGIDLTPAKGVMLSVTAFDNKVKDAIANVTLSSTGNTTVRQRQNVAAVHARGVELGAEVTAGTVSFNGSLAWTDAKVEAPGTALNGMRPAQTPRIAASGTLAWHPAPHWTGALTLRHVGLAYEDDLQTAPLRAATTLDAFAQVPLTSWASLVLRGENLFDTTIVTRNSGGTIDIGTPRTLWAGLRIGMR